MIIHPEIVVTPDSPTIKLRDPQDKVDLTVELPKILHSQGWDIGTYFHVHFINHERTRLLARGLFVVTELDESLQTNEANPYQPVTRAVATRKYAQLGEWWYANIVGIDHLEGETVTVAPDPERYVAGEALAVWNPGHKVFEIKVDGVVVATERDKEAARRIAAGELPLPAEAA